MRFMVMHKVDASLEAGDPPNPQIIQKMGQLVQGSLKDGVFENGAGLHRLQPARFLLLLKSSPASEAGTESPPEVAAALARLEREMSEAGVLLLEERLAPSARGARLASGPKGGRRWVDGPFAESKELVAGFSILNLPSKQAALEWANRYAAILGDNEVDVRELEE